MAEFNLRKSILQYRNPDIQLDELSMMDTSVQKGDSKLTDEQSNNIQKKYYGMLEPVIKINSFVVTGLSYFKLDLTGFKPTVLFRFNTIDEKFIYTSFPKDGDIASIYIRAFGEMFKPIRMDFIINEVISPFSKGVMLDQAYDSDSSSGKFQSYTIFGEIRIPKLYKHISKAYQGTSSETILKIAEELNLGFASNEVKTTDRMKWISPNADYETMIKQIVNSAWLGEEDYFDCWIDQYYNINFVNLKKQFDEQNDVIETMRVAYGPDEFPDVAPGSDTLEVEFPLALTNATNVSKSPLFITAMSLENNAGKINNDLGYFQTLQFYDETLKSDEPKNKFVAYDLEAVTNKNLGSRDTLNKGRLGEDIYREEVKKTYIGTIYFDNVHPNFQQAQVQNILNRSDSYKVLLKVRNRKWTPFLYRGQNFPVTIFHFSSKTIAGDSKYTAAKGQNTTLANDPDQKTPNIFLSGNYVVLGFCIEYNNKDGMYQSLLLGKKQWSLNPGIASDPVTLNARVDDPNFNDLAANSSTEVANDLGQIKSDVFSN